MKKLSLLFVLFAIVLINLSFNQVTLGQKNPSGSSFYNKSSLGSSRLNDLLSPISKGAQKPFSVYGDLLVSVAEIIDPATGRVIGSKTERTAIINGVAYKAIVSGRRLEMLSKLNIPLQGVILSDTAIIDESPVRLVNSAEFGAYKIDQSRLSSDTIVAEIGGQIVLFNSMSELDKFVRDQVIWESQIGPVRAANGVTTPASAYTEGTKTVLFMRVDFPDVVGEPLNRNGVALTQSAAQSLMDSSVNPFYQANSANRTSLTTTVTPTVLRMPKPFTEYVTAYNSNGGTGLNMLLEDARAAATAAGITPANFDQHIIASAYSSTLEFAGIAFVNNRGTWLNGFFDLRVTSHELGHNFGLRHANSHRSTTSDPVGPGSNIEYGDCYDSMGNSVGCLESQNPRMHFNARYKRLLDWITDANIQTITTDGVYRVFAHDNTSTSGIRLLRFQNYWVEFRQQFPNAANGILIRRDFGNNQTQLLDMFPSTTNQGDEPLVIGQSFLDASRGIRITPLAKGGTSPESMDVRVEFNIFPSPNAPIINTTNSPSASQIIVTWTTPTNAPATSYNIRVNGSNVITGITTGNYYTVGNLLQNTSYTFEVQAANQFGSSPWSAPVTGKTLQTYPSIPTFASATAVSPTQINVFWNQHPVNEDVIDYDLKVTVNAKSTVIPNIKFLSYAVTNLTPNTFYAFEVIARNSFGQSRFWSTPIYVTTPPNNQPPSPPQRVSAQVVSTTHINLFWDAAAPNVTGYNLRINGSTVISNIQFLSYAIRNLNPNTTYSFEIQAINPFGVSPWTTPINATTVMVPPGRVTPQVVSTSQINVFWDASSSQGVTGYNLRVNGSTIIPNITFLSYAVRNLTPNTTYSFEVQAVDAEGTVSAWTTPVNATTAALQPPPRVSPQAVSTSQINVFWDASPSPGVVKYNLRVNGTTVISDIAFLSYAVRNLTPGRTYSFEVQAVDSQGAVSEWSAPQSATTQSLLPPPRVSPQTVSSTQINVFWDASPSPGITKYNLRINGTTVISDITFLSYAVRNLTPNTLYTFEVQAVNAGGFISAWSSPVSATTAAAPLPSPRVSPQVVSSTRINVFWDPSPSANVVGYNLRVNGVTVISNIAFLSYGVTGLSPNTTYSFEVQTIDAGGAVSSWTTPVNATTPPASGGEAESSSWLANEWQGNYSFINKWLEARK